MNFLTLLSISITYFTIVNGQRQAQCCQEYCYDLDSERVQSAHYATKTSYLIAKGPETGRQYSVPSNISTIDSKKIFVIALNTLKIPFSRLQSYKDMAV